MFYNNIIIKYIFYKIFIKIYNIKKIIKLINAIKYLI